MRGLSETRGLAGSAEVGGFLLFPVSCFLFPAVHELFPIRAMSCEMAAS